MTRLVSCLHEISDYIETRLRLVEKSYKSPWLFDFESHSIRQCLPGENTGPVLLYLPFLKETENQILKSKPNSFLLLNRSHLKRRQRYQRGKKMGEGYRKAVSTPSCNCVIISKQKCEIRQKYNPIQD